VRNRKSEEIASLGDFPGSGGMAPHFPELSVAIGFIYGGIIETNKEQKQILSKTCPEIGAWWGKFPLYPQFSRCIPGRLLVKRDA
jgi:hypothetical protein